MPETIIKGVIPEHFLNGLLGRDTVPVSPDMLLKFQYIALIPTLGTNFRYHLYLDGRLFYASNTSEPNNPIYNATMPDIPDRVLDSTALAQVKVAFRKENFFQQPPFWEMKVRGGSMMIITARRGRQVHEIWYVNTSTPLTNLLFSITPQEHKEQTPEERLAAMQIVLSDQERQLARLQDKIATRRRS